MCVKQFYSYHADDLDMYQVVILIFPEAEVPKTLIFPVFHFVLRLETETGKFIVCSLRLAQGLASDFPPMDSKCDHRAD